MLKVGCFSGYYVCNKGSQCYASNMQRRGDRLQIRLGLPCFTALFELPVRLHIFFLLIRTLKSHKELYKPAIFVPMKHQIKALEISENHYIFPVSCGSFAEMSLFEGFSSNKFSISMFKLHYKFKS